MKLIKLANLFVLSTIPTLSSSFLSPRQSSLNLKQQEGHEQLDFISTNILQKAKTTLNSNQNKNEEILQRYNDDAFGLVFLIGGFASEDMVFSVTFLVISACAALATSNGLLKLDNRIPGIIALSSLLLSPLITSLKDTGSLNGIQAPVPLEIAVCCISMIVGLYKWKKEQ